MTFLHRIYICFDDNKRKSKSLLIPMHRAYSSSARLYKVPAGGGSAHCSRSSPSVTRWTAVGCVYYKFCGLSLDCKIRPRTSKANEVNQDSGQRHHDVIIVVPCSWNIVPDGAYIFRQRNKENRPLG